MRLRWKNADGLSTWPTTYNKHVGLRAGATDVIAHYAPQPVALPNTPQPVAPPSTLPARRLADYSLADLHDLHAQGMETLPWLFGADIARMIDLLATIAGEIADRRGPENLAAAVCGYADDGSLLPAVESHRYARIARRR